MRSPDQSPTWLLRRSPQINSRQWRQARWTTLGLGISPIIGAFVLNWRLIPFIPTEGPCLFQRLLGFISPSCGLTRSFMAIARGDISTALTYHGFGPMLFLLFLGAAIHSGVELLTGRSLHPAYGQWVKRPGIIVGAIAAFLAYYGLRLYARYAGGQLPFGLSDTSLWQAVVEGAKLL